MSAKYLTIAGMLTGDFFDALAIFPDSGGGGDSLLSFGGDGQIGDYRYRFAAFGNYQLAGPGESVKHFAGIATEVGQGNDLVVKLGDIDI